MGWDERDEAIDLDMGGHATRHEGVNNKLWSEENEMAGHGSVWGQKNAARPYMRRAWSSAGR